MNIPLSLKTILEKNQKLNGIVNYTVSQYDIILKENNLYFFEEYTDHGVSHIESVLNSTIKIIPEKTLKQFLANDPESISVYILATILHDIGMHITSYGLSSLISGNNDDIRIQEIDSKTWKELWNDFLDDARRFGDYEKKNIIGNISWDFRAPDIEYKDKLTGEDKKLIGEFIRRNHPRIAHEIALKGFPTEDGYIPFASDLDYELRNICGLVARSHGVKIRSLFTYLTNKFQDTWIRPYNIEMFYLMVLLRIADYFQIDSSRTPDITVKLKTFNSPISKIEHLKHLDVKYVQPFSKDPETLILQCEPRNSYIFIKLRDLFEDVQKELDTSWAILGEIYGKEPKEKQPKIAYRRIKSNIDNVNDYSKNINYIPEKINFKVSNELPKLLIGPLYGNDPSFGVRELLQNSVDSCREREFLENSNYVSEITITLFSKTDKHYFQIEDNGSGMSLNIVKNYFLEVGSSLRKSSLWKKTFSDEAGESKVQRSGKFGIGVLASFLIGDKLSLETRDSNSSFGLSFSTDLTTEQIEITKINKDKVGTIITIEIDKKLLTKFSNSKYPFDRWYLLDNPKVTYLDKTNTLNNLGDGLKTPGFNDKLDKYWRTLKDENYNKIFWTYENQVWNKAKAKMISNGILIPEVDQFMESYWSTKKNGWVRELELPFVSVFDFDGNLPLNLSRNNLDNGDIPFKESLILNIYKDVIAKLLTTKVSFPSNSTEKLNCQKFSHPAIRDIDILLSKKGFILKNIFFTSKNSNKTLLEFSPKSSNKSIINFDIKDAFIQILRNSDFSMTQYQYNANIYNYKRGAKLFLNKIMFNRLFDNNYNRYSQTVRKRYETLNTNEVNTEISYKYNNGIFDLNELNDKLMNCNYIIESKLSDVKSDLEVVSSKIFKELLTLYFQNDCIIPYEIEDRKKVFKYAFDDLNYYIKKYIPSKA